MNKNSEKLSMLLGMGSPVTTPIKKATPKKKKKVAPKKKKKALPWSSQNKGC